jgi:hypothetical protein
MLFKFLFEKTDGGFTVTNKVTGSQVSILARDFGVVMVDVAKYEQGCTYGVSQFFFAAQYRELQKQCMEILLNWPYDHTNRFTQPSYQPDFWKEKNTGKDLPRKLKKWWHGKAVYNIRKRFATHWNEMMEKYQDPARRTLSRALCSAFGPGALGAFSSSFLESAFQSKYWLSDLLKYPAAAYALRSLRVHSKVVPDDVNWMEMYSDTGKPYRSLNKTLMSFPRCMYGGIVEDVRRHRLDTPWYGKVKILFMLTDRGDFIHSDRHLSVFRRSTNEDILRVARMARYRGLDYKMNRMSRIEDFKRYLNDYPETYHGDLKGLFMRSFRWHEGQVRLNGPMTTMYESRYKDSYALPDPPWGELDISGLTLLKTVGEVRGEGKKMSHCVGSYAYKAAQGQSFIYHYEKSGNKATIEMNNKGVIIQVHGPQNQQNGACRTAKVVIKRALTGTDWCPPVPF